MPVRYAWGVLGALMMVGAGCATMNVQTDAAPDAAQTTAGYRTYAWLPLQAEDRAHNPALVPQVQQSADRELAAKGYQRIDSGEPDFRIGWHANVENRTEVEQINPYYGYVWDPTFFGPYAYPGAVAVREYREGTLVLDVVDASTNKLVWRGSAEAEVPASASLHERAEKIDEGVKRILEKFPPK